MNIGRAPCLAPTDVPRDNGGVTAKPNVRNWAMTRRISRAGATGNSRAILPFVTMPEGREVGARNGH